MLKKLIMNCRYPKGFLGYIILSLMNKGHGSFIRQVLKQETINPTDIILDIGCGGGLTINYMAAQAQKVYGVDYSQTAVKKSQDENKDYIKENKVEISQANVDQLPFDPETFDLITAFETIYFWQNIEKNFAHIYDLLKPNGRFLIAVEAYMENGEAKNFNKLFDCLNCKLYSSQELQTMLKNAGFEETIVNQGNGFFTWLSISGIKK